MLAVALEHVVEDEFAQELGLLAAAQIDRLDFPVDVALFVGQEEVVFAAAADEGFLFQPLQAFLDLPAQGQPVGVNLVDAEGEQVVNSSKNRFVIDIPEEDEDYFERLLGYSSNVISWHIQHKKEQ